MTEQFLIDNYEATVIIPEKPNGKWIWKAEFLYAFDKSEQALYEMGYTRVYYGVSDKYGSPNAIELMYKFYRELLERYAFLEKQCTIFGFSRGALYAFNFTMAHPECVEKVYLDAPVLDLNSWPRREEKYGETFLRNQVKAEYGFSCEEDYERSKAFPVYKLKEFFALNKPTLLVAGEDDSVVEFSENAEKMISFAKKNHFPLHFYVKKKCDHHPHSFGNVNGSFQGKEYGKTYDVYSSEINGTDKNHTQTVRSDEKIIIDFIEERYA